MSHCNVAIIGSGPAAHTAAIYASRAQLSTLLFEGDIAQGMTPGGQLTTTTDVENFPGFPEGILGGELCERLRQQSARFGTQIRAETVASVDLRQRPFRLVTSSGEYTADTLIVATGATARRMAFEGSDTYWNNGISACAVCDGAAPIFRKKPVAVVGGGDSAMEEAMFLSRYASKVYVVHRRDAFRASKIMQERLLANPKVEVVWNAVVVRAEGDDRGLLSRMHLESTVGGAPRALDVAGLFFAIGHEPASKFLAGQLDTDADGYIRTEPGSTKTSVEGVFAAGDVQDRRWRQAITAAGTGCMAALEAEHFLSEHQSPGGAEANGPKA